MLTLIYVAVWCHWVPMISCYPLDPMYYLPNYFYAISTVWLPGSSFLSIWKKDNTGQITYYLFNSICVLPTFCYSWKLTLICILCCAPCVLCMYPHIIIFFAYLQMTLLIHVNSMTAFNASHFLYSETWHMISLIGHQRILTSVILKRLTQKIATRV